MHAAAIQSESRKLLSTPGWAIAVACLLVFGMIMPIGNAITANVNDVVVTNAAGMGGVADFGLLILMVLAALTVTQEYRFGTVRVSFMGLPQRWPWLTSKAALMIVIAAVASSVLALLGVAAVSVIAESARQENVGLVSALPLVARVAVASAIMVILALGVAAIVRSTAVAVALIVLWPTVVELLLANLPGLSDVTPKFLLWSNVAYAMTGRDSGIEFPWGAWGSIAYLGLIAVVVFGVGVALTMRRPLQD